MRGVGVASLLEWSGLHLVAEKVDVCFYLPQHIDLDKNL